jgi:hypothetical protein
VEYLPSWLPGAGFKAEALQMRRNLLNFVNEPYAWAKEQVVSSSHEVEYLNLRLDVGKGNSTAISGISRSARSIDFGSRRTQFEMDCVDLFRCWHRYCTSYPKQHVALFFLLDDLHYRRFRLFMVSSCYWPSIQRFKLGHKQKSTPFLVRSVCQFCLI